MSQYDKLDALIVQRVSEGWTTFVQVFAREVKDEAERLARAGLGDAFRVLDRRFQALRKSGKLTYTRKDGWQVTAGVCATPADYWKAMYEHREAEAHQLGLVITSLERQVAASAASPAQAQSLTDEQCEALIEASDGHWKEDVFCIGGPELMALLRAAAGAQSPPAPSQAQSEPDTGKPWELTSWSCAAARVDNTGMHCPENKCADCPNRAAGIQSPAAPVGGEVKAPRRQYYYKVDGCRALNPLDPKCICWHAQGTGPCADVEAEAPGYEWRDAPAASVLEAQPQPSESESRFFMDHGMWHDRVTGQHLYTQDQYDAIQRQLLEAQRTADNLARALRREIEPPTFMGEPITLPDDEAFRQFQRDRIAEAQKHDAEQAKPKLTSGVGIPHGGKTE